MQARAEDTVVAVDLGGTSIRVALVVGRTLLARQHRPTPAHEGPEAVADAIAATVRQSLAQANQVPTALGIAAPGPLNGAAGIVYSPPNLYGWHDVPLTRLLEERLRVPVRLIKDTNAAALAEHRLGAGLGTRNMLYVTLSTGVGGSIILNEHLYEGPDGTAGEIGHVTVDQHGPRCNCGNIGCIEAVASGTAIARRAAELIAAGSMAAPAGVREPSAAQVIAAAHQGDEQAADLVRSAGRSLGLAFVGLVHLFNPEAIIIGGGLLHAGSLLLEPLDTMLRRHAMVVPGRRVRLEHAALGDDVGLWGAALHALAKR